MLSWTQVHFLPDSSGFSLLDLLAPHLGSGGGGGRMSGLISRQYKHLVRACLASFGRTKVVSDICCCISMFTTSFDAAEMLRLGRPSFINYKKVLPGLWPLVSGLWPDPAILASGAAAVAPAPSASARSDQIPIHPFVVVVVDVVDEVVDALDFSHLPAAFSLLLDQDAHQCGKGPMGSHDDAERDAVGVQVP
eukprot:CAMPEP_0206530584 /NCGR_PEP_ID=MMETSP0325_2-20121206/3262_1 /ASSEMBLY_ACC=CAM_ASM_000347 /TAXON_ID=2866 /ORGANISM="Crypthecodinium cohnii, Strain Seligo" /LENGTH=192 /DNA_ID=CAMNT_0054026675 /DNA_START=199 /DNA_END=777 /DNA_ORIENTATION=-